MKRILILTIAALFFSGFSYMDGDDVLLRNATNIDKLEVGMTRKEVTGIMGTGRGMYRQIIYFEGYVAGYSTIEVTNPDRAEKRDLGDESYEVVYYFTDPVGLRVGYWDEDFREGKVAYSGLTPLVFKDERLAGMGWDFIQKKWQKNETIDEEYYWIHYWGNGGH